MLDLSDFGLNGEILTPGHEMIMLNFCCVGEVDVVSL